MDPQSAIAHLSWLQITQVTPPHMPSPISDTNELVAEDDPAPDLDPPGAQEAPAFCGRYKVRTYSRRSMHPSALTPPMLLAQVAMCRRRVQWRGGRLPRRSRKDWELWAS
jgi:hypothetical protein